MAAREPNDPRCKDCPEPREPGRARCALHLETMRKVQARRTAELKARKRCVVCGKASQAGTTLCGAHRAYYRDRARETKHAR